MAFKTRDQVVALMRAVALMLSENNTYADGDFLTNLNAVSTALDAGDDAPEDATIQTALDLVETKMGELFSSMVGLASSLAPVFGRLASCPDLTNTNLNLDYFRQYMTDNGETVLMRGLTYDTAATITGTGAGAGLLTLSKLDPSGKVIDVGRDEDISLICTKDFSQGATAGAEQFTVYGEGGPAYPWQEGGSSNTPAYDYTYGNVRADFGAEMQRLSGQALASVGGATSAGNLMQNGDFEQAISGTGTTKLPRWTINAGDSTLTQETSDPIFGTYSLAASANFEMDNFTLSQKLKPRVPYFIAIKLERVSSATGTVTVKVMDSDEGVTHATLTQALGSLTNATPVPIQPVIFILPDTAEDVKVQVELASLAVGTMKLDDVIIAPATYLKGYLAALVDGTTRNASGYANGRFKNGDKFVIQTAVDTAGEGLVQEYIFNRPTGRYMPSAEIPTMPDPA